MDRKLDRKAYQVMQCANCGAPVHYDARLDAFHCVSCGSTFPYAGDDGVEETTFTLRHVPVTMDGELFRPEGLGEERDMAHGEWGLDKNWKYLINQKYLDHRVRPQYGTRKMFFHICPQCGGDVQAFETQNIWNCSYCGNSFMKEALLSAGQYDTYEVVDTGDENLPHFAIPFELTREQAMRVILDFAALRPRAFADQELERRVGDLWTYYIPHQLCDASLLFQVENESGTALLFQDCVNWATPLSDDHNYFMLSDLGSWDFSKIVPFSKKFAEGDVWFDKAFSPECDAEKFTMANLLRPEVLLRAKSLYPGERHRVNWMRREIRARKTVMLPVYFLDKKQEGAKVYFMVNGQTGAVCALGKGQMKGRSTLFAPGTDLSGRQEITMRTPLLPVTEQRPACYGVVPPEEAFRRNSAWEKAKKSGFFGRLFGKKQK